MEHVYVLCKIFPVALCVLCASSLGCLLHQEWYAWEWETGVRETYGSLLYPPPLSTFLSQSYLTAFYDERRLREEGERRKHRRGQSQRKRNWIFLFILCLKIHFSASQVFNVVTVKGSNKKWMKNKSITKITVKTADKSPEKNLSAPWIVRLKETFLVLF